MRDVARHEKSVKKQEPLGESSHFKMVIKKKKSIRDSKVKQLTMCLNHSFSTQKNHNVFPLENNRTKRATQTSVHF